MSQHNEKVPLGTALESQAKRDPAGQRDSQAAAANNNGPGGHREGPPRRKNPSLWLDMVTGRTLLVTGQLTTVLAKLAKAGEHGVEGLDFPGGTMYRLSARIHLLKRNFGLDIETHRVPHPGGTHARYVLTTPLVRIS